MTTRYHINPETGRPNKCRAKTPAGCKFTPKDGEPPPHYATEEEAQASYEKEQAAQGNTLTTVSKAKAPKERKETSGPQAVPVLPAPPDLSTAAIMKQLKEQGISPKNAFPGRSRPLEDHKEGTPGRDYGALGRELQEAVNDLAENYTNDRGDLNYGALYKSDVYKVLGSGAERVAILHKPSGWVVKIPHVIDNYSEGNTMGEQYSYGLIDDAALAKQNARYAETMFFTNSKGASILVQEYLDPAKHHFMDMDDVESFTPEQRAYFWSPRIAEEQGLWDVIDTNVLQETTGERKLVLIDCLHPYNQYNNIFAN